ncbi:MAG: RNA methyltransferase [Rhodospirillaceae bacterium]|jgi:tRNA/rRNA methyltransferase|nr:RNA methyltransferase [Rhodospirillaceae bacterium]MBT6118677.1 RNA methyltransferase [Rhodospirillaceae bacterium]
MAGTDASKRVETGGGPAIVLVRPQLGENIGFATRAMLNCGLTDLRLVAPRDGWPNDKARAASAGGDAVIESARVYGDTAEAVADLNLVYATTARPRGMSADVVAPREAAAGLRRAIEAGQAAGVLFGPERSGLTNDDIALADAIMTVPLNPGFSSIQLGHAVMILGYEWYQAGEGGRQASVEPKHPPAAKVDLIGFFEHLERELDACGFLHPPEMRPTITRNLRTLFQRARLTDREVRTLRGVVAGLSSARNRDGED